MPNFKLKTYLQVNRFSILRWLFKYFIKEDMDLIIVQSQSNIMAADDLAMQRTMVSAAMIVIYLCRNIAVSAPIGLTQKSRVSCQKDPLCHA